MRAVVAVAVAALLALPLSARGEDPPPAVSRDLEAVVVSGAHLHPLSTSATYVERPPPPFTEERMDGVVVPEPSGRASGWRLERIEVLRWEPGPRRFVQIPHQVDERFPRYLTNYASGFGPYSQADLELTYAFDWEGKRKEGQRPGDPYTADFTVPGDHTTKDPVEGLDDDDELVFLWRDAGARAPGRFAIPEEPGVEVAVLDPVTRETRYVYVHGLTKRAADVEPLVHYVPDPDADAYILSNHGSYGGAPGGPCHLGDGVDSDFALTNESCPHRRPKDSAWVEAETYRFHYAGRWKLDGLEVRQPGGAWSPSLVDRWKGRAFQQREGNAADIGGFEDENDWSRSSVTLGVRAGPVRVLRETWGADSGTHVTRLDAFYPASFTQVYRMRVHPIPPDGVYAFWDHRAGTVDTYYTPVRASGVAIDGDNDEIYGLNSEWQEDHLGASYFTIDATDPTLQPVLADHAWDQVTGPYGTLVTTIRAPGAPAGALTSYYRDDARFDDGTGHDPIGAQGSFGAHGIHFFFTSDTDNLFLPAPVNEFVAVVDQLVLPGRLPNVGEDVARLERAPLVVLAPSP